LAVGISSGGEHDDGARRQRDHVLKALVLSAFLAAPALAAPLLAPPSLRLLPSTVAQGGSLTIVGAALGCALGNDVVVLSRAFSPRREFAGVPAAVTSVRAGGRFRTRATIPRTRRPGTYVVTARCGGGNLGIARTLTVRRA
jgi:hypothetical protein